MTHPLRKWLLLWVLLFLSLAGVCAVPAYRGIVKWRARSLASKALEAAQKQDMVAAVSLVRSAYHLRPMEPEVLRAVARVCDLSGDPAAVQFWQILSMLPAATPEDRRCYVQSALDRRQWTPKIDEQLQSLLKSEPNSAAYWLLKACALELVGNGSQSKSAARHAHALDVANEEATLYLGTRLLGVADTHREAVQLLEPLMTKPGRIGFAAAVALAQQPEMPPEMMERLQERLEKDPLGGVNQRLLALELAIRRSPEKADALLSGAVAQYRKTGGEDLAVFGAWLGAHRAPGLVLEAISQEVALKNRQLFLVYLDALAAQNKWRDVESAVSTPGGPLEKSVAELFKARCAHELGDEERSGEHWRAAQAATVGNPEQAFYMARYARQFGRSALAESIYRSLTLNAATARTAYVEMLGLAAGQGTEALRTLLKEMLTRWPNDEAVQNDYCYCSLLLREEMDSSRATAAELVKKTPGVIAYRTTLALAWLRYGNPQAALEVYRGLDIDWLSSPASFRAVVAAALWANGQKEEARKMAATVRTSDLKPEEQALMEFPHE